jgi:hypothetical protein
MCRQFPIGDQNDSVVLQAEGKRRSCQADVPEVVFASPIQSPTAVSV